MPVDGWTLRLSPIPRIVQGLWGPKLPSGDSRLVLAGVQGLDIRRRHVLEPGCCLVLDIDAFAGGLKLLSEHVEEDVEVL